MIRYFLFFALCVQLAFSVGCDNPVGDDDATGDDDDGGDDDECEDCTCMDCYTTFHIVVPYGWEGDVEINDEVVCEDITECSVDVLVPDDEESMLDYEIELYGWNFLCVTQEKNTIIQHAGETIEFDEVWTGPAQCGLAPEGEYVGAGYYTIETDEIDKEIMIDFVDLAPDCRFPVTKDTFEGPCDGRNSYFDVGIISDDLETIYYHEVLEDGDVTEDTITLQ